MSENELMYLPKADWSPRFDTNFFTITMDNKRLLHYEHELSATIPAAIDGRSHFPAYYYEIVVYRGRESVSIWRRYSHFKWLYQQVKTSSLLPSEPVCCAGSESDEPDHSSSSAAAMIKFPSGSCFYQKQDDKFAQDRMLLLKDWLNDLLVRPGYASHPAVKLFLELQ